MGHKAEKGKKGEAVQFYSRKQALRHLQIGLPNFIRLCLWKGIYPSQPNKIKTVGKGDCKPKIYYKRKDINLLLHEPVLHKLREIRAFNVKIKRAKERNDKDKVYRLMKSKPRYRLEHIVRELYPTVKDALENIEDCLKSVFIFATLPKMTQFNGSYIGLCKRLKLEFMNFCIAKQAVRKCFISIKGYYLEAEIKQVKIRWLIPHQHVTTSLPTSCDYRLMANQMEFDVTLLRSLLTNLYRDSGLVYPPKFSVELDDNDWKESDILAAMTFALVQIDTDENGGNPDEQMQQLEQFRSMDEDIAATVEKEAVKIGLQTLFRGKKIFLNREIPREIFCFLLRCCGATEVSWDRAIASGATFDENDEAIEYHILDRPLDSSMSSRVSRFFVQPQFVFDCINAGRLLPVKDYMPGVRLIPHLCPFVDYTKGYVPPEYRYLQGEIDADALYALEVVDETEEGDEEEAGQIAIEEIDEDGLHDDDDDEEEEEEEEEEEFVEEMEIEEEEEKAGNVQREKSKNKSRENQKRNPKSVTKQPNSKRISKEQLEKQIEANKEIKLREMSLPKKRINLYKKMKHAEKKEKSNVEKLKQKRQEANKRRNSIKK